jgi:hypothetical protein
MLQHLYAADVADTLVDTTIREIYHEEREKRRTSESTLVTELYKVDALDWGGLYQNSLEKTIVDRYVKRLTQYASLVDAIESDLQRSLRSYVISSWYNHWTSILIEDIFRDHQTVLPAVGLIKQIDFFWHGVPFDLKVTFLPEGYIKEVRQQQGLRPEMTELKRAARNLSIAWDRELAEGRLLQDLWARLSDHPAASARATVAELRQFRLEIVRDIQIDASDLMVWFYENQGVRRFDSSNRLFLVLVDRDNFFDSWKLKRAHPLLKEAITKQLGGQEAPGRDIDFSFEGDTYHAFAHTIIVVHDRELVAT